MTELLRACIASGQVDPAQIEAHRAAGEIPQAPPRAPLLRPAVPVGWALVPLEPTPEMIEAMKSYGANWLRVTATERYRAMLAAAPTPEGA